MSPSAPTGKVYCWLRVSSASQSLAHQRRALKKAYPKGIFIESKQSGVSAKTNRDLMDLIDRCEPGDKIAALRMSRVARSMKTLCDFFEACREKSVDVDLLHEKIDSSTPNGRLMMRMQMALCAWSRELIREQCEEGYEDYRNKMSAKGKRMGRPSRIPEETILEIKKTYDKGGISLAAIAKRHNVSRSYVHRLVNPDKHKAYIAAENESKKTKNKS